MSWVFFGEDDFLLDRTATTASLIDGKWHDDLDGQSLCGWAWDRGAEWAAEAGMWPTPWVSEVIRAAREDERKKCAALVEQTDIKGREWLAQGIRERGRP